ncbi:hypothetical protein BC831DRAFT_460200 [Entophlyctis helioformis]|nr:hypothetical protein BC831DRAFT_460200 [Entophlyctis helioformis]
MDNIARNRELWQDLMDSIGGLPAVQDSKDHLDGLLDMPTVPVTFGARNGSGGDLVLGKPALPQTAWLVQPRQVPVHSGPVNSVLSRSGSASRTPVMRRASGSSGSLHRMIESSSELPAPGSPGSTDSRNTPKGIPKHSRRWSSGIHTTTSNDISKLLSEQAANLSLE